MKDHARVVVIGGGIGGCSVLYHLTKLGWTDVVLVEKGELTSGSTWHSVGNTPLFASSLNLLKLQKYSLDLYQSLGAETGHQVDFRKVGSLRLATTQDLLHWYQAIADMATCVDIQFEMLSPKEAKELNPLFSEEGVIAASYQPADGYADASGVTHALAKGARDRGAEIYRDTRLLSMERARSGEWKVITDQGNITTEVVVNAGGVWGREIGRMVGAQLPLLPMEHQYVVTNTVDDFMALGHEIPITRDPERSFYLRQEGDGILIGFYEKNPRPWAVKGVPEGFSQELLAPSLDQIEDQMLLAMERFPVLEKAGIKKIVNGPDAYTPDGLCILGEVPEFRNYFVLGGFSCFGILYSGGAGKYLAEWIVEGRPSEDMHELDVRRYGPYAATDRYLVDKISETYEMEFAVHYPHEERPAGRPIKTTPLRDHLKSQGAVFQARSGWERPAWFAPEGIEPVEEYSFVRPNWFDHVGRECKSVRAQVGVLDQTSFGKIDVSGSGASAFLDRLCANRIPPSVGRIMYTQMLNDAGGIECDVTVTRLAEDKYLIMTAAALLTHDLNWIEGHAPDDGGVVVRDVTAKYGCLTISGPRSRDLLQRISDADFSSEAFPFMSYRDIHVGHAPVRGLRVAYVGELGWELHHPIEYQWDLYERVIGAGREFDIINYGYRALDSMRMEKGYLLWGQDITNLNTPHEAGLGAFVKLDKGEFIGREALLRQKEQGVTNKLACLIVEGNEPIPHGWEPILDDDRVIGYVTSGDYGHVVEKTIVLGYIPASFNRPEASLAVRILGTDYLATVVQAPVYDPTNARMKA